MRQLVRDPHLRNLRIMLILPRFVQPHEEDQMPAKGPRCGLRSVLGGRHILSLSGPRTLLC